VKPDKLDPKEKELRTNKDYMASIDMIGEGAPIYQRDLDEFEDVRESS